MKKKWERKSREGKVCFGGLLSESRRAGADEDYRQRAWRQRRRPFGVEVGR